LTCDFKPKITQLEVIDTLISIPEVQACMKFNRNGKVYVIPGDYSTLFENGNFRTGRCIMWVWDDRVAGYSFYLFVIRPGNKNP
jgi:hypothetical protein